MKLQTIVLSAINEEEEFCIMTTYILSKSLGHLKRIN